MQRLRKLLGGISKENWESIRENAQVLLLSQCTRCTTKTTPIGSPLVANAMHSQLTSQQCYPPWAACCARFLCAHSWCATVLCPSGMWNHRGTDLCSRDHTGERTHHLPAHLTARYLCCAHGARCRGCTPHMSHERRLTGGRAVYGAFNAAYI